MSLRSIGHDPPGALVFCPSVSAEPQTNKEQSVKALKLAVFVLFAVACAKEGNNSGTAASSTSASSGSVDLTGAGATFPYPLYSKWFDEYAKLTGVKINYQSIGSGGGIRQLSEGTVDFGASDSPMSDAELAKAKFGPILHIPTVLGAVVITYNLPALSAPLNLTAPVIADIFAGKIIKWNDARIASLNPGVSLPSSDILVVHRSDGSGTTYIFTDYLTAAAPSWKAIGKGKEVSWPAGLGAKGNEGVAGQVKQTPGAIGYVELAYAKQNRLPFANLKNAAGRYVTPSIASVTAAAAGAKLPKTTDYRVSIVNAAGKDSYPISSMTWILVHQNQPDAVKGAKLVNFLRWAYKDGEKTASSLDYR